MRTLMMLFLAPSLAAGQCMLYPISLNQRVQESTLIVEGWIIEQHAAWNPDHTRIYTTSRIEIFKVFKGDTSLTHLDLITPGGVVGDQAMIVNPNVEVAYADVGIFMCIPHDYGLETYGSAQGFIRYDFGAKKAIDPFSTYDVIGGELYELISGLTGHPYTEILPYTFDPNNGNPRNPPAITSLNPTTVTAGTATDLTITGTAFGSTTGTVFFRDANSGGAGFIASSATCDITSWTDTLIDLVVRSRAGTGTIFVQDAALSNSPLSSQTLTVTYNHTNISSCPEFTYVIDDAHDGDGGYEFCYSTSTSNSGVDITSISTATDAVERALGTWHSANPTGTLLPFFAGGACCTTAIQTPASDGINVISFDNTAYTLGAGVLGQMTSFYASCGSSEWEVTELDMILRRDGTGGITWEYGPATPSGSEYDFESVVLHEFGHGVQLGHVINTSDPMHYAISIGTANRSLTSYDISGGNYVIAQSTSYVPPIIACGGDFPYTRVLITYLSTNDCGVTLPLQHLTLDAQRTGEGTVELSWSYFLTSIGEFEIQRRSASGWFETIGSVPASGLRSDLPAYFTDEPTHGPQYYRVRFAGAGASSEYSNIAYVPSAPWAVEVSVTPNPAQDRFRVEANELSGSIRVQLINSSGQMVFSELHVEGLSGRLDVGVPYLSPGLYQLALSDAVGHRATTMLIIQ